MAKRYWRIRGHQKYETIFDVTLPVGSITDGQLQELLKCLAANGNMSNDEVVGAYVKRKTKRAHELLEVRTNGSQPGYWCGNDPSFIAVVVDDAGNRVTYSPLP